MTRRRFSSSLTFALACALLISSSVFASGGDEIERPRPKPAAPMPFEPTEQLFYEAEFSKLLLRGIKIAEFTFTAGRAPAAADSSKATAAPQTPATNAVEKQATGAGVETKNSQAEGARLLFVGDIASKGWFRKLFGINFHFHVESLVEREPFTVLRTTKLDEQGKRVRRSEAVFDRAGKVVSWTQTDPNDPAREPRVVTTPLEGTAHDIISAIYFIRTQPLAPGKSFDLTVSDSGQVYKVPARVSAEKKLMKTVLGRVAVVRVDVELFGEGRPVEGDGKMSLWVTNDARRVPVRAKLSSDMGTLDITLKRATKTAN